MPDLVERPLAHYRVLEFPGLACLLAGKTFADLGADVIKLEPPWGDPARRFPPFVEADTDGESPGLTWSALSIGKRHITVDFESKAGLATIRALAAEADVLIESFLPGSMEHLGLGPDALRQLNPRLVVTSISHFGQDGPYAGWRSGDIVNFAMSGYLHMTGPGDGPPLKPSAPLQTQFLAAMHAVCGTLIALRQRQRTGFAPRVDQASRDVGLWMLTHTYQFWDMERRNLRRMGSSRDMGGFRRLRTIYDCKDGQVVWVAATGHIGGSSLNQLVGWMEEHGMAPEWLKETHWEDFDYLGEGPEHVGEIEDAFAAFYATKTKRELLDWALEHRLMLAPLQGLQDVLDDPQLAFRDAWRFERFDGHDRPVRVPGPPVRLSGAVWEPRTEVKEDGVAAWKERGLPHPRSLPIDKEGSSDGGTASSKSPRPALPLAGLRVIDFSTTLAGPSASRHLADFGAEVIRIESNAHPDTIRTGTPYAGGKAGVNRSGYFGAYNAGKKSLALNMTLPQSRDIVRRLLAESDVLLEAYVPGVMQRWGLGWDEVHALNPRLIMASHCLQGQTGPRSQHRGYGQIASAMSGWYDLTGLPGEPAVGPYSAYTDFLSWPYLLTAVLVALEVRDQTGKGMHIDHAQLETSVHYLTPLLLDLQVNGRLARRQGNREAYAAPNNAYPCAADDTWCAITVTSDEQWVALCHALGHTEAASDRRFATHLARKTNEDALDDLLSSWTRLHEAKKLAEHLQSAGIAAGPVHRAEDLFADPQLQHRRFFVRHPHAELGDHAILTQTFRIEGLEAGPFAAAPLLGEHTVEVLTDVLGMSPEEIAEYAALGLFE